MKMLQKKQKTFLAEKKVKMWIWKCLAASVVLCGLAGTGQFSFCAEAAQEAEEALTAEQGQILEAEKRIEMKAAPEESAETLMTFQAGDLIFVVGETADDWYRVLYQGKEGYVEKDGLTVLEMDIEGLDAEMAANEAETKFVVEVVEKYRADAKRSKIWGTVIIVLVAGIFGVGIFSAIRTNQNEDDEKSGEKKAVQNGDKGRKGSLGRRRPKPETEQMKIEDLN